MYLALYIISYDIWSTLQTVRMMPEPKRWSWWQVNLWWGTGPKILRRIDRSAYYLHPVLTSRMPKTACFIPKNCSHIDRPHASRIICLFCSTRTLILTWGGCRVLLLNRQGIRLSYQNNYAIQIWVPLVQIVSNSNVYHARDPKYHSRCHISSRFYCRIYSLVFIIPWMCIDSSGSVCKMSFCIRSSPRGYLSVTDAT